MGLFLTRALKISQSLNLFSLSKGKAFHRAGSVFCLPIPPTPLPQSRGRGAKGEEVKKGLPERLLGDREIKMRFGFFLFLLLPVWVSAHPVIYKDGLVYWGVFSSSGNEQRLSYTLHPHLALELSSQFDKEKAPPQRDYHLGFNVLAKRWFFEDSQANIYLSLMAELPLSKADLQTSLKSRLKSRIEMDWESRRLYTTFSLLAFKMTKPIKYKISSRLGFAPYLGSMEELQTWMIFQFSFMEKTLKIEPLMRFFYRNVLWEIGSSLKGDFFLSLMVHY